MIETHDMTITKQAGITPQQVETISSLLVTRATIPYVKKQRRMQPMNSLIKKNLTYIPLVLMLGRVVGMSFALPQMAVAGMFCAMFPPAVRTSFGNRWPIALAVVGFTWFVIAVVMYVV